MRGRRLTTQTFIERAQSVHGDKYDYSKTEYTKLTDKVKIICPVHGEFKQSAKAHLKGMGCCACAGKKKLTTAEFIEKAKAVHGDRYDYSKTIYTGRNNKVLIICPEHGEFEQNSYDHTAGSGCPACIARPNGYWKDQSNINNQAHRIIEKYGHLPAASWLQNHGYGSFVQAVCKYYGGFHKIREDLGLKSLNTPANTWNREKILGEFKIIISDLGYFPARSELKELHASKLLHAAEKHFGSLRSVALACGISEDDLPKPEGYWNDYSNVVNELTGIIEDLGDFPSDQDLLVLGYSSLRAAIRKHGGTRPLRRKLGYKDSYPVAEDGHYCDSYSEKIIDDFLSKNSIQHERDNRYVLNGITCVPDFTIGRNGLIEVLMADYRESPNTKIEKRYVRRYLKKREQYLNAGYDLLEVFPSDFYSQDKFKLRAQQIISHFGINVQKNDLIITLPIGRRSPGYWLHIENVKNELLPICKELGRFPTYKELEERKLLRLSHAINRYHGGMRSVAEIIGYPVDDSVSHKPRGFWKDNWPYIESQLSMLERELGHFPTSNYLRDNTPSLYYAVIRYYGGIKSVRKKYYNTTNKLK